MLLKDGKELLFWIDLLPCDRKNCLYLTHVESDSRGMKMTGGIPFLWEYDGQKILGPDIYDEDNTYRVTDVDYQNNCIWIEKQD
jgi:hypothetical protein